MVHDQPKVYSHHNFTITIPYDSINPKFVNRDYGDASSLPHR